MADFVISELKEAIDILDEVRTQHSDRTLWWRGQDVYEWELKPAVFRGYSAAAERNFNLRFRTKARTRHTSCPSKDALVDWLLLAQHYGVPTRLLDWTEGMLTGLFFSARNKAHFADDGALFCLLPSVLNKHEVTRESMLVAQEAAVGRAAHNAFYVANNDDTQIVAFIPDQFDLRHIAQNTMMTIHGRHEALDEQRYAAECLIKIRIKGEGKLRLRALLDVLGVKSSSLFPDLSNLAEELKELRFRE